MKHQHKECVHIVEYCKRCDVVYCVRCPKEWRGDCSSITLPWYDGTTTIPLNTYVVNGHLEHQ